MSLEGVPLFYALYFRLETLDGDDHMLGGMDELAPLKYLWTNS